MYDRATTDRALAFQSREQHWLLERHSRSVIDSAIAHLNDLYDEETGRLSRELTTEEQRYIDNERMVCSLDFRYYLNYVHIIGWDKRDVRFTPNLAQSIILDLWGDSEAKGHAIIMQELKARQLGMTTLTEVAVSHRVQFHPRTYAVIASADPAKTEEMAKMIDYCWSQMPWWLMPTPTKFSRGIPVEFGAINTTLKPQWGNQYHGVARGQTPNVAHLSEVSSWLNADDDIDSALFKAMHPTPDVFIIMESTALGRDNWWYEAWELNKVAYPQGRSLVRPVFLPWFVGTDIYPTEADLRQRPIPRDWVPLDRTTRHAERARQAVLANPLWFRYIAQGDPTWEMPRAQQWYYECEREMALKKKGGLNKFLSEMPADDQEAFQNTAISVIDQEIVLRYREEALARPPLGVYTIVGPTIPKMLTVPRTQWDASRPSIAIAPSVVCRALETYTLIPVAFEGYIGCDPMWKLFIWEWPEEGETYGLGVDTSDGIGEDWSTIEVLRRGRFDRPHAQVAEFASPYVKANQLWEMALALGALYSVFNRRAQRRTQSRICIECKGNGEKVQDELKKRGWINFHPWKKLDNKRRLTNDKVHKEGIFTNVWYRSMMMDTLLTAIDEDAIDLRSPWLVSECETLERDPDEKSARAAYNTHDDRVLGIAFPLESLTVDDTARTRYRRTTPSYIPEALASDADVRLPYAVYQAPPGASSTMFGDRLTIPLARQMGRAGRSARLTLGEYQGFRPRLRGR